LLSSQFFAIFAPAVANGTTKISYIESQAPGDIDIIPPLTTHEYGCYIIGGWARPEVTKGFTSVGIVYERSQLGSIIQVQRIEGELFETEEQAEQHGVKLCKDWIDKQGGLNLTASLAK
jgi:hypothetical protein